MRESSKKIESVTSAETTLVKNNDGPLKVRLIRTYYPHMSDHSGMYQFVRHMDKTRFMIDEQAVSMGESDFSIEDDHEKKNLKKMV